ncbi:MAG: acyltransferase [Treponemataceae bacterium]|nr:acyltransferase [Treponemataceae bacterium]
MSYITLAVYPVLLFIALFGATFFRKGQFNQEWTNLSQSKSLQGLAAFCIVCHHTSQQTCASWLASGNIVHGLDAFIRTGFLFVAIFFFWSGFGLYKSFANKPDYLKSFFRKRIVPVWLPYAIVCPLFTLLRLFVLDEKMSLPYLITNLTGLTLGYTFGWYVQTILIFYGLFALAFGLCKERKTAVRIIAAGVAVWTVAGLFVDHNDWFLRGEWWYNSVLLFPLGIVFAQNEEKLFCFFRKNYTRCLIIAIASSALLITGAHFSEAYLGYYGETWATFGVKMQFRLITYLFQALSAVALVWLMVLGAMKIRIGNKVLEFCGSHTLEIYLTHAFPLETLGLLYNYSQGSFFFRRPWLLLVAVMAVTFVLSVLLKKICSLLLRRKHTA